ncbi:MAG: HD domain-containing phosphohydrolase [Bryobacteraceae bacterium]|jgi:putative two-component system response regulator
MNARSYHRLVSNAGIPTLRKPVAVCTEESWVDLLKPERERHAELQAAHDGGLWIDETEGLLFALGQAVEQRDRFMAGHCERLAFIGVAMGVVMRLERTSLLALYRGGYLHDVGKLGIPDSILFKPGALTAQEWSIMRTHTIRGEEICRHLNSLRPVLPIIRHHHERFDGSGYPDGLRGEQIPLLARVMQIADIYDALTSTRSYKRAYSPAEALETIRKETERGWRDPQIVKLFLRLHTHVISKDICRAAEIGHSLEALRASLTTLREFPADSVA